MKLNKPELRKKYKSIRQKEKSSLKDEIICQTFLEYTNAEEVDIIFAYCSVGTEVDTSSIIKTALERGIRVAVPRCSDVNGTMDFYIISDIQNQLVKGMFSIMEPDVHKCTKAIGTEHSLCIVPGLAFDKRGYRLGYGKGYYDRFLRKFKGKSIGLCYGVCLCDELPFDNYDRKVDTIITENDIINLR